MGKYFTTLLLFSTVILFAYPQCKNSYIRGASLQTDTVLQCQTTHLTVNILDGYLNSIRKGESSSNRTTQKMVVKGCYYRKDGPAFTQPSTYSDKIKLKYPEPGRKMIILKLKNSLKSNDTDCSGCQEFFRDTLTLEVLPGKNLVFSPNPTTSYIEVINTNDMVSGKRIFGIYTFNGQLIKKTTIDKSHARIDLRGIASGTYLVKEEQTSSCERFVKKIVKLKR